MIEPLLTARQLADLLGFSPATVQDWCERGELPGFRIGGRLRFRLSEVERFLEARRTGRRYAGDLSGAPTDRPARPGVS